MANPPKAPVRVETLTHNFPKSLVVMAARRTLA